LICPSCHSPNSRSGFICSDSAVRQFITSYYNKDHLFESECLRTTVYTCANCGCHFHNPFPSEKILSELYSNTICSRKSYERYFSRKKTRNHLFSILLNIIAFYLGSFSKQKPFLLDYGCGWGQSLDYARVSGFSLYGLEISPSKSLYLHGKGYPVFSSVDEIPLGILSAYPSLILLQQVLEHLPDPSQHIRAISNHISPGSIIYITVPPYKHSQLNARAIFSKGALQPIEHLINYSRRSMNHLASHNGLQMISLSSLVRYPPSYPNSISYFPVYAFLSIYSLFRPGTYFFYKQ